MASRWNLREVIKSPVFFCNRREGAISVGVLWAPSDCALASLLMCSVPVQEQHLILGSKMSTTRETNRSFNTILYLGIKYISAKGMWVDAIFTGIDVTRDIGAKKSVPGDVCCTKEVWFRNTVTSVWVLEGLFGALCYPFIWNSRGFMALRNNPVKEI